MKKLILSVFFVFLLFIVLTPTSIYALDPPTYRGTIYKHGDWHYAPLYDNAKFDFDSSGNMYVVENWNPKIYKFNSSGDFTKQWGVLGTGDGQFQYVISVAADSNYVYALDYDMDRVRSTSNISQIQSFDTDGNFIAKWNTLNNGSYKAITAKDGYVYVVGYNTGTSKPVVQKFDHLGNLQFSFDVSTYSVSVYDIDIESDNTIDLSDNGNIRRYSQAGNLLQTISGLGSAKGSVEDSSGNHYVFGLNPSFSYSVNVYNASWNYISSWGSGSFSGINDIDISPSGNIYTIDYLPNELATYSSNGPYTNLAIREFTTSGALIDNWLSPGSDDGEFYFDSDVAIDSKGNKYVIDVYNSRIQVFDENDNYLRQWPIENFADNDSYYAPGITCDNNDDVYVTDTYNNIVYKYTSTGSLLYSITDMSNSYLSLSDPNHIAVDADNNIYISDDNGIWFFDDSGNYMGGIDIGGDTVFGVALDTFGNLYTTDDGDTVSKYTKIGDFTFVKDTDNNWSSVTVSNSNWSGWEDLIDIAIDSQNNVYLLDSNGDKGNNLIRIYNTNGDLQTSWGGIGMDNTHFYYPRGIAIDGHDTLYVADSLNNRVQYYSYNEITSFNSGSDPTPTPTSTPNNNSNLSGDNNSLSQSSFSCGDSRSNYAPNLFQINTSWTGAKLFFGPLPDTNNYYISYSTKPNAEEHGILVNLSQSGVQNFSINLLKSNTTYYFKVRGQTGCMPGPWSNIMKATTNGRTYYKSGISNTVSNVSRLIKTTVTTITASQTTNSPLPTNIPVPTFRPNPTEIPVQEDTSKNVQKHCFLWWCW